MEIKVAIQGIRGSFSYLASLKFFKNQKIKFKESDYFKEIFEAVEKEEVDYGVVPIENSIAGSIYENYDYLNNFDVKICGEVFLKIEHFLLGVKSNLSKKEHLKILKKVYSHPKALEQCKKFFDKYSYLEKVPYFDTARSAEFISQANDLTLGAIASKICSKLFNLRILKENIEDYKNNYTRFLIIVNSQRYKLPQKFNKCSLIFLLKHKPGTLYKALEVFAKNRINLTKIESRPLPQKPFEYFFFLDFVFSPQKIKKLNKILEEFKKATLETKNLGFYESAKLK